jgi:hypothetical protein
LMKTSCFGPGAWRERTLRTGGDSETESSLFCVFVWEWARVWGFRGVFGRNLWVPRGVSPLLCFGSGSEFTNLFRTSTGENVFIFEHTDDHCNRNDATHATISHGTNTTVLSTHLALDTGASWLSSPRWALHARSPTPRCLSYSVRWTWTSYFSYKLWYLRMVHSWTFRMF